ncbi:hypothetical protein Tsedi_01433 [Tepidimonas sediminis]|uniref:Tfp pilus assembly protein FimV n=1 Tax=Tepidimonas sediminis TaxID=2588941 RepID=A0A554WPM0_9BURK|nr:hypothetical protein [Tepidimonas sediminis]TSE25515.1 hypothetical protein Tsedi_01433 [Tepidimonas sediminis]
MSPKDNRTLPTAVMAAVLLAGAIPAGAQSLGAAKGAVFIGRPLDVVVASTVEGDDAAALCAEARVRYGETSLAASDVALSVVRDDPRGPGLRVRTRTPVDEPFVTVEVRVGCQGSLTRSYTLLADLEPPRPAAPVASSTPVASAPATPASSSSSAPASAPGLVPAAATAPLPPETPVRLTPPASRPPGVARLAAKTRPVAVAQGGTRSAGTVQAAPAPAAAPPAGPRLKLEPVDLAAPAPNPAETAQAPAGAMAPPTAPDGATEGAAAPLQQELERLRAEQQRLLMAVETLNRELGQARAEAAPPGWLPWAVAALASLLAAAGWLRNRGGAGRAATPWWQPRTAAQPGSQPAAASPETPPPMPVAPPVSASPPAPPAAAEPVADETVILARDSLLERELEGAAAPVHAASLTGVDVADAHDSAFEPAPVAALDLAALHELWERVDFFEDLGQIADAVAALRSFVLAHPRASEAPYLRWWRLASEHGLDARLAQATYEQHYHRLLQGDGRRGTLLDDAALLQRLQAEWPGQQARATVEQALASQPDAEGQALLAVRSLAAFDDLITLHGVLDLLPLLPLTEADPAAPAAAPKADDHVIEFDLSGWTLPPAPPPAAAR